MQIIERKRKQANAAFRSAMYLLQQRGNARHVNALTVTMERLDAEVDAFEKIGAGTTAPEGHNANVTGLAPAQETTK